MIKNKNHLFSILTFSIFILVLSSCSSIKDQFTHQRYTDFKVKHANATAKPEETSSLTVKRNVNLKNDELAENTKGVTIKTPSLLDKSPTPSHPNQYSPNAKVNAMTEDRGRTPYSKLDVIKHAFLPAKNSNAADPDTNTILFILLCIFIPPLACYLKDAAVSTAFWIALICCLLSFSYFAFQGGGIFWLVAMIVAFVHCFKK